MEIVWSNKSIQDLRDYRQNSRIITDEKLDNYVSALVNYVDNLSISPQLGKFLFVNSNNEYRQLLYGMHRIFYSISNNKINILSVVHTSRNITNILKYINSILEEI